MNAYTATISQSIFIVLLTIGSLFPLSAQALAEQAPALEVIVDADRQAAALLVFMRNIPTSGVQIYLEDLRGIQLLKEDITDQSSVAKRYQLHRLPPGAYRLRVEGERGELFQPFKFNGRSVTVLDHQRTSRTKPLVELHQRHLRVQLAELSRPGVNISILDQEENVLYQEKYKAQLDFQKTFDLDQFQRGTYSIKVKANGKVYSKHFTIKS